MTEDDWGSDHLEPKKKRSFVPWILGCLGCGMFFAGSAAVALYFGGAKLKDYFSAQIEQLAEPDVQWPKLGERLPFEERPSGFEIVRWPFLDLWQLEAERDDLVVFVMALPPEDSGTLPGKMLTKPDTSPLIQLMKADFEATEITLTLQGRELFGARLRRAEPTEAEPGAGAEEETEMEAAADPSGQGVAAAYMHVESIRGDGLGLEVTPEGSDAAVLVWLFRRSPGGTVTDEDARAALSPFLIGPDRR